MGFATEEQRELLTSLRGTTCPACGERKRARQSFCRVCYFKLPVDLRKAIYNLIGDGYEEAHADAMRMLGAAKP